MQKALLGAVAAVVAVIAAIFIWFNFVRDDAPDPFALTDESTEAADAGAEEAGADPDAEEAGAGADAEEAGAGADAEEAGAGADAEEAEEADAEEADQVEEAGAGSGADDPAADGDVSGTWTVGEGSEAGYRVVEDLGNVQDFEAVGRTSEVTGTIDIAEATITSASFEVQVASIASDDERRDGAFADDVMNATEFPTATFELIEPIELGSAPADGEAVAADAVGELTLRGTTNPVTVDLQAQLLDGRIEVVGSAPVAFSDYGIANPSNPFVTVRDEGRVEFRLLLDRG